MGRLDGKVALITGGARGQGAVEVKLFASEGARVVFGDLLDEEGMKVEAEVRELGGEATYVQMDVSVESDWESAVKLTETTFGKLDILVNNAAIVRNSAILETPVEEWDEVMAVNARGVFLGTKHAIPAMQRAGGGSIINISSVAGILGRKMTAAAYSASKGAVRVFTKTTAIQHSQDKIRCNSIHPGPINTEMLAGMSQDPEIQAQRLAEIPLERFGQPEDVAYGVLFLASDEASWITGVELPIDGGITAQ